MKLRATYFSKLLQGTDHFSIRVTGLNFCSQFPLVLFVLVLSHLSIYFFLTKPSLFLYHNHQPPHPIESYIGMVSFHSLQSISRQKHESILEARSTNLAGRHHPTLVTYCTWNRNNLVSHEESNQIQMDGWMATRNWRRLVVNRNILWFRVSGCSTSDNGCVAVLSEDEMEFVKQYKRFKV